MKRIMADTGVLSAHEQNIRHAIVWARGQLGRSVQPCRTVRCSYHMHSSGKNPCATPDPAPGADDIATGNMKNHHPLWNFYCMRFVRNAFDVPAEYPKAQDMCDALKRDGALMASETPPEGAIVFWHWSVYGHVGLSVGNSTVIHTGVIPADMFEGVREERIEDVTRVLNSYNGYDSTYLGWAHPPDHWLQ